MTALNREELLEIRARALASTAEGPPAAPINKFWGVGPISDMTADDFERRMRRFEFEAWYEANYSLIDDQGKPIGVVTAGEQKTSMHRGYPSEKVVADYLRAVHENFRFGEDIWLGIGLGGGHAAMTMLTSALLHPDTKVFVDTPPPETDEAKGAGAFRRSWAYQIKQRYKLSAMGDRSANVECGEREGHVPSVAELEAKKIQVFMGVGHETTGATTYNEQDIKILLEWRRRDPKNRHIIIDGTSLLGAMPWSKEVRDEFMREVNIFTPAQKAMSGSEGLALVSLTPEARAQIDANMLNPGWPIPRETSLAVAEKPANPFSSKYSVDFGPFYDTKIGKMHGGVINTTPTLAIAQSHFDLLKMFERVGDIDLLNERAVANREVIENWIAQHPMFEFGVTDRERRGAAVTLLRVNDTEITDVTLKDKIVAHTKQLLDYRGVTHPNGEHESGLDVARYVNPFPGTPGDFRMWIGGTRPESDIRALLGNIEWAYNRAKAAVMEELLTEQHQMIFPPSAIETHARKDDAAKAYTVLIVDQIGTRKLPDGSVDISEVRKFIEEQGGVFHEGPVQDRELLEKGKIHFIYQPDIAPAAIAAQQHDAVIAAAKLIPSNATFKEGGVRIGAGTGNMESLSWGGGFGKGGEAPLMNTPGFNSVGTAQSGFKAALHASPTTLPIDAIHHATVNGMDTATALKTFPTEKLEGKRFAILGIGNIGSEMAKLAKAFRMEVVVYADEKYKKSIESMGYKWAATPEEAAKDADFLSPHLGLNPGTQGIINDKVIAALKEGAVIVNFDRGQIVDTMAVRRALERKKLGGVVADADIFADGAGPLAPYKELERDFPGVVTVLPHIAVDSEHISRVEGAKQAVRQIVDAIRYKEVANLVGDLPGGYINMGRKSPPNVGFVTDAKIAAVVINPAVTGQMRKNAELVAAFLSAADATHNPVHLEKHNTEFVLAWNNLCAAMEAQGMSGARKVA